MAATIFYFNIDENTRKGVNCFGCVESKRKSLTHLFRIILR